MLLTACYFRFCFLRCVCVCVCLFVCLFVCVCVCWRSNDLVPLFCVPFLLVFAVEGESTS